jgi:hypothetical protein
VSAAPKLPPDPAVYRYENALKWIRLITGLHYFGGAFEPEHMRQLANIAADALAGTRDLPDFEESQERSKRKASELAEAFGLSFTDGDDPEGDGEPEGGAP